jgi:hypothetical protein
MVNLLNIQNQKDIELTNYFDESEKSKKAIMEDRIIIDRLKKVI